MGIMCRIFNYCLNKAGIMLHRSYEGHVFIYIHDFHKPSHVIEPNSFLIKRIVWVK